MLLKKYIIALAIVSVCSGLFAEEDTVTQNQPTRIIHITKCKKIDFGLTIDQTDASQEERETALAIISDFCNTQVNALSEELTQKAPHVAIALVLLNIEEDADVSPEDIAPDNTIVDDSLNNLEDVTIV